MIDNLETTKDGIDDNKIKWKGKKAKKFGSTMNEKRKEDRRIIMGNINTLPSNMNRHKIDLWHGIVSGECDINIIV